MPVKVYKANNQVVLEYDPGETIILPLQNSYSAVTDGTYNSVDRVKIVANGSPTSVGNDFANKVVWHSIKDRGGATAATGAVSTVTYLNDIFDDPIEIEDFVKGDTSASSTGITKLRHIKATGGGEDRDEAGTLELDTHSASIGLYDSFLKISETDLNNTGGKSQAYGNFRLDLQNAGGSAATAIAINMGNLYSQAVGDFNFAALDISGNVTFSGTQNTVTFSGDTSGIDYGDLSNAPVTIASLVADTTPQLGGDLDVNGNKIVSVSHGDITFDPDGGGNVIFRGNATQGSGRLILNCENNSHGITIKGPPHSAAASYTLTLPDDAGSSNQVLKTDGSGGLSWVDQTDTSLSDTDQTLSGARTVDMDGNYLYFKDSGTTKLQYDPNDSRFEFHGGLHVSGDFVTSVGGVSAGEVKFQEPSMGGTHGVILKGPSTNLTSDVTFVLPGADGSTGQFLKTDGSGNLSFASAGGSGSTTFLGLTDTPSSFTASKFLKVNSAGNAVEFVDGGGSGISDVVDDTTPQLGGDLDTNSKNIVYAKTSTTDHSSNGEIVKIGTGSTTQGELCYYKSDGTWAAANASAESTSGGCLLGIALGTDPDVDGMLLRGMYTLDHSPGSLADELYVSTTAGDVTGNVSSYGQNNVVRVIGYCLDGSNGQIWFNPSNDFIVLA